MDKTIFCHKSEGNFSTSRIYIMSLNIKYCETHLMDYNYAPLLYLFKEVGSCNQKSFFLNLFFS